MSPEQLAEQFPDRFRYFDMYLEYGRRRGNMIDGLHAYNDDLAKWVAEEFGELPDDLVNQARAV
jgi:hypothetical protein